MEQNTYFPIVCQSFVKDTSPSHTFRPVTRFDVGELSEALSEVKAIAGIIGNVKQTPMSVELAEYVSQKRTLRLDYNLSEENFSKAWSYGIPLVIVGVGDKLHLSWSPDYFKKTHGRKSCEVEDTSTCVRQKTSVAAFFTSFGNYDESRPVLKLKVRY